MLTKVFRSGNSLAVRIPKELAIVDGAPEVEIERQPHAVSIGATLITNNVADFADYRGLRIENWMAA